MLKSKWIKIFLIVIGLTICGLIFLRFSANNCKDSHCLITQLSSRLFDLNTVNVNVSSDLKKTDFRIININSGKVIYEDGYNKKGIKNEYGFCLFDIYYKDSLLFELGHYKLNNWHTNDYTFAFRLVKGTIDPTLIIIGPDRDRGELFYKRFDRNDNGQIYKIVYFSREKKIYKEELIKSNKPVN
jgi:hypothetical protein